ncbi:unnamed protein product [Parnassius apollo]|uniref:(apollo) hypothetical protein n=1 Tax=Parnassius apollo TaxID=110799 RepID=A0A8S3VYI9_PARAO|nr:unnamed protein product [Parnassius apollo]
MKTRKGKQDNPLIKQYGKSQRELEDIISLFKETDPDSAPIFVARDLQKLPPITFDHVDVTRLLKDIVLLQQEVKIIKDNYVTKTHLEELKKDKSFLKTSTSPAHHHKVGRRCSAFLLDVGTTFGDSGPMGLSHELSTADVPLQTTDVQTEKISIAQVASRARDSVDALAPASDMHKADLFTSGSVTAYNGMDGRQSFSAGGTKVTPIPMHNSPSKSKMNDDEIIVVNKYTNNNNAIKDTSCDVNFETSPTMAEILKKI